MNLPDKSLENLSLLTRRYILAHPSVKDCLMRDLVNYSALAREICGQYKLRRFEAVIAACKRFAVERSSNRFSEANIRRLLGQARVRVEMRMAVAIAGQPFDWAALAELDQSIRRNKSSLNVVTSEASVTLILPQSFLSEAQKYFGKSLKHTSQNLAHVILSFGQEIEKTPGVVAHIYGLLSYHGINIREEMSCWTDVNMLVAERDVPRVMELLGASENA